MAGFYLAEINIARMRAPIISDPIMKEFVDQLDAVNALAERSPGFVWRLKSDSGNDATDIQIYEDTRIIINMSVWESIEALFNYAYSTEHTDAFRRRGEWFERMKNSHMTMWWIPVGTIPTAEEGKRRLEHLDQHGPTSHAFTFKQRFPAPTQSE